jgi:hypothetical protein
MKRTGYHARSPICTTILPRSLRYPLSNQARISIHASNVEESAHVEVIFVGDHRELLSGHRCPSSVLRLSTASGRCDTVVARRPAFLAPERTYQNLGTFFGCVWSHQRRCCHMIYTLMHLNRDVASSWLVISVRVEE